MSNMDVLPIRGRKEPEPDGWRRYLGELAWPTLLLAGACLASFAGVTTAAAYGAIPLWLGFALNAVLAYLAFTPVHDASHDAILPRQRGWRWLSTGIGWSCAALFMAPYPAFRILHLKHHAHTNDPEKDPDYWVAGNGWLSTLGRCATIMPHYYWRFFRQVLREMNGMQRVRNQAIAVMSTFVAVAVAIAALGYGLEVLVLWVAPAILAHTLLSLAFDWLPHRPHDKQGRFHDTRVMLYPGLNILMANQNYHLVHHLYPRVPFYRYGQVFDAIRPELERRGARIDRWRGGAPTREQTAGR